MPMPSDLPPIPAAMTAPALAFLGITYRYGTRAVLTEVSFGVWPKKVTLLLGPNGAGKTTLFSLACRLLALQTGDIRLLDASVARSGANILRPLGIVFQQPTLDLDLTVRQNLLYFAALHGLTRAEASHRMAIELERIGMASRANEPVRALNGGHRRRLEIARALLSEPRLLLLDEPTVGLDQPTRRALVTYLHELARDRGIALLWATHLLDEAEPGDAVVILARGQIRATGSLEHVIATHGSTNLENAFNLLTAEPAGTAA